MLAHYHVALAKVLSLSLLARISIMQRLRGLYVACLQIVLASKPLQSPVPTRRHMRTRKRGLSAAEDAGGSAAIHDTIGAPAAAVPTPEKGGRTRKAPQDIGISALILGAGTDVQAVAAAADAVDELPLATAGFTQTSLQAACDYLAQRDPRLVDLIRVHGPPERLLKKSRGNNFATLAKAIVFQVRLVHARTVVSRPATSQLPSLCPYSNWPPTPPPPSMGEC